MRRIPLVKAGGATLAVAACAMTASATTAPASSASPAVAAPRSTSGSSFAQARSTFATMSQTRYAHRSVKDVARGYYQFDCVGFTMFNLAQSNPVARKAFRKQARIAPGRVGKPSQWYGFFVGQNGPLPPSWARITNVTSVRPGDYLAFTKGRHRFVGHAAIVANAPKRLADGSYSVDIFDSTGHPHGPNDTRRTDPRNFRPAGKTNGTGLGRGTMRLLVNRGGQITGAKWSVDAGGPNMSGVKVAVGRAR